MRKSDESNNIKCQIFHEKLSVKRDTKIVGSDKYTFKLNLCIFLV